MKKLGIELMCNGGGCPSMGLPSMIRKYGPEMGLSEHFDGDDYVYRMQKSGTVSRLISRGEALRVAIKFATQKMKNTTRDTRRLLEAIVYGLNYELSITN